MVDAQVAIMQRVDHSRGTGQLWTVTRWHAVTSHPQRGQAQSGNGAGQAP